MIDCQVVDAEDINNDDHVQSFALAFHPIRHTICFVSVNNNVKVYNHSTKALLAVLQHTVYQFNHSDDAGNEGVVMSIVGHPSLPTVLASPPPIVHHTLVTSLSFFKMVPNIAHIITSRGLGVPKWCQQPRFEMCFLRSPSSEGAGCKALSPYAQGCDLS